MYHMIYQISGKPIPPDEWNNSTFFSDTRFSREVANHIDDVEDRVAELKQFGRWLSEQGLGILQDECFVVLKDAAEHYFASRFLQFDAALQTLGAITEEQFSHEQGAISDALSNLENSFVDAYGDYICRESEDPIPMDEFLRTATPGVPYYLGGLCKYQL